jgi:hypothetical protein
VAVSGIFTGLFGLDDCADLIAAWMCCAIYLSLFYYGCQVDEAVMSKVRFGLSA